VLTVPTLMANLRSSLAWAGADLSPLCLPASRPLLWNADAAFGLSSL